MYSTIRYWLNSTFSGTAFSFEESNIIVQTAVKNDAASTGYDTNKYACGDTQDKVFLLSYEEVSSYLNATSVAKQSSDYAKSQGVYANDIAQYEGNGVWWLRSPSESQYDEVRCVYYSGGCVNHDTEQTQIGVVPALWIEL